MGLIKTMPQPQVTYYDLLELQSRLRQIHKDRAVTLILEHMNEDVTRGWGGNQAERFARISKSARYHYSIQSLRDYYDWRYNSEHATTGYLFLRNVERRGKPMIDTRFDSEGLPHGVTIIGLFDQDGCYISDSVSYELQPNAYFKVQEMLLKLQVLTKGAADVLSSKYTKF